KLTDYDHTLLEKIMNEKNTQMIKSQKENAETQTQQAPKNQVPATPKPVRKDRVRPVPTRMRLEDQIRYTCRVRS
ncbi:MAG: hypothetical protein ACI4RJ_00215, partial [Alphaproteobacteria bacterium]